ncbi:putative tetR-like transcriptional regulator [Candidatus Desulfosporosinus infrequens]|uniref:Putative tetR-like transcriptional regulator n=1 Tax=Candidatus Desulfosporosinus infrequens TaxID=2043169 RepID=A0A2U3L552_9FIRM|nr:putative tetR-like transcriptional regulator [Candidatus Desulfosporosinus infrequens]
MSKAETRECIIKAAQAIFSEKGYESATTREIAVRANVNEITLFRHFGSKAGILQECINRFASAASLTNELDKELIGDLQHDLECLARTYLTTAMKRIEHLRLCIMEAPHNPELARIFSQIPIRLSSHLTEYLLGQYEKRAILNSNFELISQVFYGLLFQFVLSKCGFIYGFLDQPEDEVVKTIVAIFITYLEQGMDTKQKIRDKQ